MRRVGILVGAELLDLVLDADQLVKVGLVRGKLALEGLVCGLQRLGIALGLRNVSVRDLRHGSVQPVAEVLARQVRGEDKMCNKIGKCK